MAWNTIDSIMTRKVVSVAPATPITEVVGQMRTQRASCIVVCVEGAPVGVISERDVVAIAASPLSTAQTGLSAGDFMTSPVATVPASDSVETAVALAEKARVRHLPVVNDDGELVGLVTQTDLVRAYSAHMETLVAERTAQLSEANRKLEALSLSDGLLGVGNRRAMDASLGQLHEVAMRYTRPYSIALFDVDHFKPYNDHYGHLAGDQALKRVARCMERCVRTVDSIYRYGGEELLVVLPETPVPAAATMAQRGCVAVHEMALPHEQSSHGVVTVSCGLSGLPSKQSVGSWRDLVEQADQALYRAKRGGRNCIAVHE